MSAAGGGFIEVLSENMTKELDVPVSRIHPFTGLVSNSKSGDLEAYELLAPIALGLAMRRVDDK